MSPIYGVNFDPIWWKIKIIKKWQNSSTRWSPKYSGSFNTRIHHCWSRINQLRDGHFSNCRKCHTIPNLLYEKYFFVIIKFLTFCFIVQLFNWPRNKSCHLECNRSFDTWLQLTAGSCRILNTWSSIFHIYGIQTTGGRIFRPRFWHRWWATWRRKYVFQKNYVE